MIKHEIYISREKSGMGHNNAAQIIKKAAAKALAAEGVDRPCLISVMLTDNEGIRETNRDFRSIDAATDVLSFPLGENGVYDINHDTGAKILGDIVISMQHAVMQADLYGHSLQREIAFLTVHSMLHLLGYDHEAEGLERVRMREKEEAVLTQLGLKRNDSYYSEDN